MTLTVSWQPWEYSSPTGGYNLADLWDKEATVTRWPEFLAQYAPEWHPDLEAVRRSIIELGIWAGGDWHQGNPHGMPVVSSGHYWSSTWRAWGELLASVWNTELGQQFTYIDFYISGHRLPLKPSALPPTP